MPCLHGPEFLSPDLNNAVSRQTHNCRVTMDFGFSLKFISEVSLHTSVLGTSVSLQTAS
jgi:hypothetical protein